MGLSESDSARCKKHPSHRQSPGVCSSCLREKLSKLTSAPPSLISRSSSLSEAPPIRTQQLQRKGSGAYVAVGRLKKSNSVSCENLSSTSCTLGNSKGGEVISNDGKKTSGLLKKLISTTFATKKTTKPVFI